jgi:hypothetical protein
MSALKASSFVVGGKFRFKGDSKSKTLKRPIDISTPTNSIGRSINGMIQERIDEDILLTETQRRHKQKLREKEKEEVAAAVAVPYRERINKFNYKLSTTSEHNDIPRISAAGNG